MPLPAETSLLTFLLIGKAALLAALFLAALFQWVAHRRCAYHIDTGFWRLMSLGLGLYFLGRTPALFLDGALVVYALESLTLLGILSITVALLRLAIWQPHRHATP